MSWIKVGRQIGRAIIYLFALIGLILTSGFVALRLGWTNTTGQVDQNDRYFSGVMNQLRLANQSNSALTIFQESCRQFNSATYRWLATPEWAVLKTALVKDQEPILKASALAQVSPRLLVSMLVVEQLRLYNSDREVYKQVFAPLKILGVQSKFSWGIMGLKEETAKQIEANLKDPSSPYYLGVNYEHLLDFTTTDSASERFNRLVDQHNHYYSYLYSALGLKQLMVQWQRAGYDINDRPEILATLFNLGFDKSAPKAEPQVGGAEIEIGDVKYSFGGLAFEFYYSSELIDIFPWQ